MSCKHHYIIYLVNSGNPLRFKIQNYFSNDLAQGLSSVRYAVFISLSSILSTKFEKRVHFKKCINNFSVCSARGLLRATLDTKVNVVSLCTASAQGGF